ncbi:hypothetical protein [Serratia sp. UGAL515B_01]|uniref:hypothetical protein n=1 Tax=Serratia sp. UGAL515B_01 TaxID=2986763 RepID=UPI0029540E50|nr:hypothetical protein [Serratia sp. UGAL515B_01]WON76708.1 hypothetical protein OK023_16160 [Serratia sp. UGAL515B_01]
MKVTTVLTTLIIATCLLGCSKNQVTSSYWAIKKDNDNIMYLPLAKILCHEKAEEIFPIECEVKKISKYDHYINNTGNDSHCNYMKYDRSWTSGEYGVDRGDGGYENFGRLGIETYLKDINTKNRNDSFYQCMSIKGWTPE